MIPRKIATEEDANRLYDHFLEDIVGHDRYLRFGYAASDDSVHDYLDKAFDEFGFKNMWFIVEHENAGVVGSVHVSFCPLTKDGNYTAEMGFTVAPEFRGKGLGQELFIRGSTWAMSKGAKTLYTQCLSENQVMQHIAKKNGMTVVTITQGEKEATIQATKGKIQSYFDDKYFDNLAFVDSAVSLQQQIFKSLMRL
jgi:RimJ/RimL family protein N-acetyltransferase